VFLRKERKLSNVRNLHVFYQCVMSIVYLMESASLRVGIPVDVRLPIARSP